MVYFDHASATPVDLQVFEAMLPWFTEKYANPSSLHRAGQEGRAAVDNARMKIAQFIGAQPTEVYFTGSGTESCNWALIGVIEKRLMRGMTSHVIVSEIEHSAILEAARFLEKHYSVPVSYVSPDEQGIVSVESIAEKLRPETSLVSVMAVNNEIGTVQPIKEIADLCRERGVHFHSDACQATGFLDLNVGELQLDLMTINASKIHGPKGVGVLYVQEGVDVSRWTIGGTQEFKKRAGTENVPAIVGFGKAIELINQHQDVMNQHVKHLRNLMWEGIQKSVPDAMLNGDWEKRSPNNLNVWIKGVDGETLVKRMDLDGFAFSTGSACTSGEVSPSHVLIAIGRDEEAARSSIRLSLGKMNTEDEVISFVSTLAKEVEELRKA